MTGNTSAHSVGTKRSEVNPNPHEAERRIALEAGIRAFLHEHDTATSGLIAHGAPKSIMRDSEAIIGLRALLTTKAGE